MSKSNGSHKEKIFEDYVRIGFLPFSARRVLSILSNFGTARTSDPGNIVLSNLNACSSDWLEFG